MGNESLNQDINANGDRILYFAT